METLSSAAYMKVEKKTPDASQYSLALKRERIAKTKGPLDFAVSPWRLLLQVWLCWRTFFFFKDLSRVTVF